MTEDRGKDAPSLEPPSLFGRKRRKKPAAAPAADEAPTTIFEDTSEPTPEPVPEPTAEATPAPTVAAPAVAAPAVATPATVPATVAAAARVTTEATRVQTVTAPAAEVVAESPEPEQDVPSEARAPREPWITGPLAAVLTGLLVGALIVAATSGSLRLCTSIKGTSSCGGPGFFLLLAIMVVAVLVGMAMLRAATVPEPGSTSFLAVGLLSVVVLLFLVGSIFEWWMVIVIPLVSVATFSLSHWVTTTFIDPAEDGQASLPRPDEHDVR